MSKVKFIFALHNHQPVGNFHHISKDSFEKSYRPFIDVLERHSRIKVVLHFTGPLLDWIAEYEKSFFSRIKQLVKSGQVELMGGGYYEP